MKKKTEKYNIGLDIGTNSVGWCVTNLQNEVLKFKGKRMCGVRLFDEGQTAAATRIKRGQRRRYMRRQERIRLLQELIGEMIIPIDKNFFIRLQDGFLWSEDKRVDTSYTLFADKDYTDSDYYQQFPTIYHLREFLMTTDKKADPRQIYLALHHMIKYRGNFLYPGQSFNTSDQGIERGIKELEELLEAHIDEYGTTDFDTKPIIEILDNKQLRKKEKQDALSKNLMKHGVEKRLSLELSKAILGYSFDLSILFGDKEIVDENGKSVTVKFSDAKYEEQVEALNSQLQERFEVIQKLQDLYSQYVLSTILKGKSYISEAMLERYNKHHNDLIILKELFRKYANEQYNEMFRDEKDSADNVLKNYVNYIKGDRKCNQEELYKTIKRILKEVPLDDEQFSYCIEEMDEYQFLLRLNNRENSSIPWQMNQREMLKIIDNQAKYYPILAQQKDKILSILSFKIPYYVGPLNPNSKFSWIKRTEEKIYPWNLFEIIDESETAEGFITRMTSYCTYLPTEKVMPKYSLLYSKYCVLNELANIRVNEKKLTPIDKQKIINDLFMQHKKVTDHKFCEWLKKVQWGGYSEFKVTGYQKEKEFASSLGTFIDFYRIFNKIDSSNEKMIEEIIYWLTVFEEKSIVEKKIKEKYSKEINERQLKSILKLRYKGWSSLSRRLLTGLCIKRDEINYNIMYYLENSKKNFKQIITDKDLGFNKLIKAEQIDLGGREILIDDIKALQGSPAIKRGIWQTVKIIQELIKCMGKEPQNIMIEFARSDEESKRSTSRKNKLLDAFKRLEEETKEYNREVVQKLKDKKYASKLDSEKMFLYFIQNGKCMYTGEALEIDELDKYEVDHIIPRCYIKDDSIENKVLVLKRENQRKLDNLLISTEIQSRNRVWWEKLYKHGLIGTKKYNNLMRAGLSEEEKKGFINRQLVETRQICKHVAVLLQSSYINSNIVIVKAELSSLFREKYCLYKNRAINDFHHAQDAYLAAVIGNTLLLNKNCNSAEWIYDDYKKYFNKDKEYKKEKHGYILSMFDREILSEEGKVIWQGKESLKQIIKVFDYKNYLVTKRLEEGTGQFYDETIYGKNSSKKDLIPLKQGLDVKKYGGYSGIKNAYSVAIAYKNKKKIEKRLIGIPVQVSYSINQGKYTLEQYLEEKGYKECAIIREKVYKYQLMEDRGNLEYITSYQEMCNAKQLILDKQSQELIYWIVNDKYKEIEEHIQVLDETLSTLINKVKVYYTLFNNVWEQIDKNIDHENLDWNKKSVLIGEILKLTKANAQNANLKLINKNLSDRVGRMQNSAGINIDGMTFVDQSITGLFERRQPI